VVNATGIGPVLRKARLVRGKSIEEASRETRIRAEYLQALERERFENLLGDVYVRGFLRSYSSYLGLDSDKVVSIYSDHFGPPARSRPPPPPTSPSGFPDHRNRDEPRGFLRLRMPRLRGRRLSWSVLLALTVIVGAVLVGTGVFSRSHTAPPVASGAPGAVVPAADAGAAVTVAVEASADVHLTITADGRVAFDRVLRAGEGESFQADDTLTVALDRGGSARLTVNGRDLGSPGSATAPYQATFGPNDFGSRPSPGPSVG
jgi:cytoskeletal protein RodZ